MGRPVASHLVGFSNSPGRFVLGRLELSGTENCAVLFAILKLSNLMSLGHYVSSFLKADNPCYVLYRSYKILVYNKSNVDFYAMKEERIHSK